MYTKYIIILFLKTHVKKMSYFINFSQWANGSIHDYKNTNIKFRNTGTNTVDLEAEKQYSDKISSSMTVQNILYINPLARRSDLKTNHNSDYCPRSWTTAPGCIINDLPFDDHYPPSHNHQDLHIYTGSTMRKVTKKNDISPEILHII